jgi:hypothetical protein
MTAAPRSASEAPEAAPPAAPAAPAGPWWTADEPHCPTGELGKRTLTWGSVFWCGENPDRNLQNELGLLARCMRETVNSYQIEPEADALAGYLRKAEAAGLDLVLCNAVRREGSEPNLVTYHGRPITVHRKVLSESRGDGISRRREVRYRFSCADCQVFSETTSSLAVSD